MKVLVTGPSLSRDLGGVGYYFRSLLPFLNDESDLQPYYLEIGSDKSSWGILHPLVDQVRFGSAVAKTNAHLVHVNPSLNFRSFLRDGIFIRRAKKRGLAVLVFIRGWNLSFEKGVNTTYRWFFRNTYAKADGFVVLSSYFENRLRNWGIAAPIYRATTIVDERPLSGFSPHDKLNNLEDGQTIKILFLARLMIEKGIFETLEAFRLLIERDREATLSIAGDGPAVHKLKRYLRENKHYDGRVTYYGYVRGEKKRDLFSSHHIYCLPSYYSEGMPNALLEAMAFGMPVVTRPVGGVKDFFEDGKMGYITESTDPRIIADLLDRLILNRSRIAEMGYYNYRYARENFLASSVAANMKDIYMKTAAKSDDAFQRVSR